MKNRRLKRGLWSITPVVQMFRVIALIVFIMGYSSLYLSAANNNRKVQFKEQTSTLKSIFDQVEQQTGLITTYSNNELDMNKKVRLSAKIYSIEELYTYLLQGTKLEFEIANKYIIIHPPKSKSLFSEREVGAKRTVTGRVLDNQNLPLPGASIIVKGTTNGTIADSDGRFQLSFLPNTNVVLVASFVGMEPKQVTLTSNQGVVDFRLASSTVAMDEVMIIGAYGVKQKRADMVGSAYQVNAKQIENLPVARIDNMLDGMVPGLQVTYNSDDASSTKQRFNLRVRGDGSMTASSEPLWIVDGTPIYTGEKTNLVTGMNTSISPLTYINADDIESFTVLKDASATAIYGANGSNGVILITTKKGKAAKLKINLSQRNGISAIDQSTKFKVLNADQYRMLAREAYVNSGRDLKLYPFQDNAMNSYSTTDTDWSDVYYKKGTVTQTNLSITGGNDNAKYFLSGAYYKNQSTIIGNTQERFSTRANIDLQVNKHLNVSFITAASYNINNIFNPGNDYYELLPIYSPYNADGSFRLYNASVTELDKDGNPVWTTSHFLNTVAEREQNDNMQRTAALNTNLKLEYTFIKGLRLTSQVGADYQSGFEDEYDARTNWSGMSYSTGLPMGYASRNNANFLTWTTIQRLNYDHLFGKHAIGALVGIEASGKENRNVSATGEGFANDRIKEVSNAVTQYGSSSRSTTKTLSYIAQGIYSYDNRYYVTINGRMDGSSVFGTDSKWGVFGSVGGSWNIHNEKFYKLKWMNVLKLKASYGTNGNSRLGDQQALGLYSYSTSDSYMNVSGGTLSASPNPKLSWELSYIKNVGLRAKFFDRIDIDVEGYWKRTNGMLSNLDVSRTTGDTRVYRNMGEMSNNGIEVTIDAQLFSKNKFGWNISLNAAHNKNTLLKLYNGIQKTSGTTLWKEGYDMNTLYLIRWAGVDPRDGAPLWYDANGNITRTYSINNRVPWKSTSPALTGGFTNTLTYKNLSFTALVSYVFGGHSFSTFGRDVSSDGLNIMSQNQSINQLDRWQKPGDITDVPKLIWGVSTQSVMNSTRYVYNTTNMRLRNVTLAYQLQSKVLQLIGISSIRISAIADNLALWTPYGKKEKNSYRQSISGYPSERTYSLGLDVSF